MLLEETAAVERRPAGGLRRLLGRIFSFRAMLAWGLAAVAVLTVSHRFNDPDVWFHLKLGEIVWNTGSVPSADAFSYTAYGHPWIAHEWLAQLSVYAAYHFGGYAGLMLWLAGLTATLLVLVYVLCYRYSGSALAAFMGGLCAWFFATVGLAVRPLLLGHVFFVVELLVLESATRDRRRLWFLPPLFAVWVNCHGSYFFGLGILGAYWVCTFLNGRWGLVTAEAWDRKARKFLTVILVLCGVALCCNPVGVRLLTYPLNTLFQQPVDLNAVQEWMAPDLRSGRALAMIAAAAGVLLLGILRRTELKLQELLFLAMAFGLATQHVRMLFLFGIVVSPILCRLIAPLIGRDGNREHPIANAVLMGMMAVAMAAAVPNTQGLQQQVRQCNPAAAADYIRRAGLRGPMLNEYVFGGYLIWALPEHKVFIDGRGDVYDWTGVFAQYGRWATLAEDPRELLDRYGVQFCLLRADSAKARVASLLGWKTVYADEIATVLVRP